MKTLDVAGLDALRLTTQLLQRARVEDRRSGVWEAADFQWWWRKPRPSDAVDQRFWLDESGPIAAAVLTDWTTTWGLEPIAVGAVPATLREEVLSDALARADAIAVERVETLVRDDDVAGAERLRRAGFTPTDVRSGMTWMDAERRPASPPLADGLRLVDRASRSDGQHPMARRNGAETEARLRQVSLYDPGLDLAITTPAGDVAAYALFWFDPVTRVGLIEPMRVEDAWQRRGLGRVLVAEGCERLARRGATLLKVGWASPSGRALYLGSGFDDEVLCTTFARAQTTQTKRG
ncbi:MAG: GNAT family N-acetyltransferase [Chloroflexota bacterium]